MNQPKNLKRLKNEREKTMEKIQKILVEDLQSLSLTFLNNPKKIEIIHQLIKKRFAEVDELFNELKNIDHEISGQKNKLN